VNILARYVVKYYLKVFGLCLFASSGLFMVVDFFQRIGDLAAYDPGALALAGYFAFKLPSILTEIYPACSLLAVLLSLGVLARHRETLAMRACGMTTWQVAIPMLAASVAITMVALLANLTVVPAATAQSRYINDVSIKKKAFRGFYNVNSLWFQGGEGFFNVDYFDANNRALYGLTLYEAGPEFRLDRIVEIPAARWRNDSWELDQGTVKTFTSAGEILARDLEPGEFTVDITLEELLANRRRPSEFNLAELREQIKLMKARGLNTDGFVVDMYVKAAWPVSGLVMVLLGIPLSLRGRPRGAVARNLGVGLAVGFTYWVTMAVAVSAGRNGGMSPVLAAWTANAVFSLAAASLYLGRGLR